MEETKENYKVYVHINKINGKIYIGQTCRYLSERWRNGTGYQSNRHFNSAIQKYGWNNFEHVVLFENLSSEMANIIEIELIKKYHTQDSSVGYNISPGGDINPMLGKKHTNETKEKLSKKSKNRFKDKTNHPRFNAKLSKETIEKIRIGNIGRIMSKEEQELRNKSNPKVHDICKVDINTKNIICIYNTKSEVKKITNHNVFLTYGKHNYDYVDGFLWIYKDYYDDTLKNDKFIKQFGNPQFILNTASDIPVICLNTLKIFHSIMDASNYYNVNSSLICLCCKGYRNAGGTDKNGNKLIFEYYDQNKIYEKKEYVRKGLKKVMCIETQEVFDCAEFAANKYDLKRQDITTCCRGKKRNTILQDGTILTWKYL